MAETMTLAKRVAGALAAALVAVACLTAAPKAAWADLVPDYSWYSSAGTSFTISTPQQWVGLAKIVDGTAPSIARDSFAGKTVRVTQLNFLGNAIAPVGTAGKPFSGILVNASGGGTFSNFTISTAGGTENLGLVGYAKNASIAGLTVNSNGKVTIAEPASGRVVKNVGLLVGMADNTPVNNCTNRGSIVINSSVRQNSSVNFLVQNVGGLVGIGTGDISNCANAGAISITQDSTPATDNEQSTLVINVGGVVGSAGTVDYSMTLAPGATIPEATPADYDMSHGTVSGCSNTATIYVETPSEAGLDRFGQTAYAQASNIGGIAGYCRGNVANCTNSAFINTPRGTGVGGIVGSLRTRITSSSYSGNFSSTGNDDGMRDQEAIAVSNCTNWGDILGFVFPAGIVGRAGTYTTITDCLSGVTASGAIAYGGNGAYVIAQRWNKPFPAGIVGSTYGDVSYCANFAYVASASNYSRSGTGTPSYTTQAGYYAAGIAGNTSRYTNKDLSPKSPQPEIYACYNAGSIIAKDNMRQRALVGDNGGFVHDNVALQGCVSTNDLLYGDDPDESEASGGSSARNQFVTADQLRCTAFVDEASGTTACGLLNYFIAADNWANFWVKGTSAGVNNGYPILKRQNTASPTSITNATTALRADAEYSGAEAVPQATVALPNGTRLEQNVDFKVVPQAGATAVSVYDANKRPYAATVVGMGAYAGTANAKFNYGIDRGNIANCAISQTSTRQFNARAQSVTADDFSVVTTAGVAAPASEYSVALKSDDANLTNGQAVNAKKYGVTVTANANSHLFYGSNDKGVFNIKTVGIMCSTSATGNRAEPDQVKFLGASSSKAVDWYSLTLHQNATDAELRAAGAVFPYTGHAIKPYVTGATLKGETVDGTVPLTEGVDYRVVYGATSIDTATENVDNVGKPGQLSYGYVMVRYVAGGNYSNYEIMKFLIDGTSTAKLDLSEAEIRGTGDIIYEASAGEYRPVQVWYAGSQLTEGADYDIAYANNAAVGTASYTITGKGLYTGSRSGAFNIVEGEPVDFTYAYADDGTATVTGMTYRGSLPSFTLTIPATTVRDGRTYTVTAIADKAFGSNNYSEVSDSAKKIGAVVIPASIQSIGAWAFSTGNINNSSVKSNLSSVTFTDDSQLRVIGESAFRQANITSLTVPASVESIERRAFGDCSNLKTVRFNTKASNIPVMHDQAFQYVNNVEATYYDTAAEVSRYVTGVIKAQNWSTTLLPARPTTTNWYRLAGENAYGTMVQIVDEGFVDGSCSTVVLATFDGYWDALTASGLAGFYRCPVLLTDPNSLSPEALAEMQRLGVKQAFIAGGPAAISETVEAQVNDNGIATTRVAGANAAGTAVQAYEHGKNAGTWGQTAVVATGDGYWDALAASPLSYAAHAPIFLAQVGTGYGTALDDATLATIRDAGFTQVLVCGGPAAVSEQVEGQLSGIAVTRLQGATAVETSKAIADYCLTVGMQADGIGVATTEGYWDALTGAALCGSKNAPLVLARPAEPETAYTGTIENNKDDIGTGYIFGGVAAIPDDIMSLLQDNTRVHSNSNLAAAGIG